MASYAQTQQPSQLPTLTKSDPVSSILPDGTVIKLRFAENLTSADARIGQEVHLEVAKDVKVGDYTVISKGAPATAAVTAVVHRKTLGRAGTMDISIVNVQLVNNRKVPLCGVEHTRGGNLANIAAGGAGVGVAIGTGVAMSVAAPTTAAAASVFWIVHGQDSTINKGSEVSAYVDGDIPLDLVQFGAPLSPEQLVQMHKRRIVVNSFDYSAVRGSIEQIFGDDPDVGRGIQALLVSRITNSKKAVVVERAKLENIDAEQSLKQKLPQPDTKDTKAPIQRNAAFRSANMILYGDIVVFGRDDHKDSDSRFGTFVGGFTGWHTAKYKSEKAIVAINYRLVDARTSEVLASGEARGESQRQSESARGFIAGFIDAARGSYDMTSSNFAQTIIGEATIDCIDKIAANLGTKLEKISIQDERLEGKVAFVNGADLSVNIGSDTGVRVGETSFVNRILNEIRDPVTHEVIDVNARRIGSLTIVSVKALASTGRYTGEEKPQTGDQVLDE
jgi:curli biogenesis system outer membrane secretion channel CsgG